MLARRNHILILGYSGWQSLRPVILANSMTMFVKILLILVASYVAFEIIEHLVLSLVWLVMGKKKKAVTGSSGLIEKIAEVKE